MLSSDPVKDAYCGWIYDPIYPKRLKSFRRYMDSAQRRHNSLGTILNDAWIMNLRYNKMEILNMLSKNEAQFMLDKAKEDLEEVNESLDIRIDNMAAYGKMVQEYREDKRRLEGIINKITTALEDGK